MLNYINQNVYLPKMVPLKWVCVGKVYGIVEDGMGKKEGTPTWDYTYQLNLHVPPILLCGVLMGGGAVIKLCYLS